MNIEMRSLDIPLSSLIATVLPDGFGGGGRNPGDERIRALCADSREVRPGDWFICLHGEKHDAHQYISQVIGSGAAGIIYEKERLPEPLPPNTPALEVKDTNLFLGEMAKVWRTLVAPRVIAITGSNGKTSTKEILSFLLRSLEGEESVHATSGNLNNHFGVPFTLLGLNPSHRYAVIEMGTNHPGEIALLSRWAQPDFAAITSISPGHIGNFGDLKAIALEKSEIVAGMKPDGVLVMGEGVEPLLGAVFEKKTKELGVEPCAVPGDLEILELGEEYSELRYRADSNGPPKPFRFGLPGKAQVHNLELSLLLLRKMGFPPARIEKALEELSQLTPGSGRLRPVRHPEYRLWDDSYNANPDSFLKAMEFLSQRAAGPEKTSYFGAFGTMAELGGYAEEAHRNLGAQAAGLGFSGLAFFSDDERMRKAFQEGWLQEGGKKSALMLFGLSDDAVKEGAGFLKQQMRPNDALLVKGSRSARMERILALF